MSNESRYEGRGTPFTKASPKTAEAAPESARSTKDEPARAPAAPTRFRVAKDADRVSMNGSITRLAAGHIIAADAYGGMAGIARLREQGVELVPLG